ncbi:MAG: glycerol-3-phosphate dehydrogenase, partial [Proteobacteria bacterium]|nr:glycerol-3-phosphate dehydrogenase [Pseudomonadota bacterium]
TPELDFEGDPASAVISDDETGYLCRAAARYFKRPPEPADVVWSFAGVRPLHGDPGKDASGLTRDYLLDLKTVAGSAPMLSVYGGKITTYRTLAEAALERIGPLLGTSGPPWTGAAPLPGGDLGPGGLDGLMTRTRDAHPWLPPSLCRRYARAYGTRLERLLDGVSDMGGLGQELGAGLYETEARYLMDREWARTACDILWRRTKLGLKAPDGMAGRLGDWMAARRNEAGSTPR